MYTGRQLKQRIRKTWVIVALVLISCGAGAIFLASQQQLATRDAQPKPKAPIAETAAVPTADDLNGVEEKMAATELNGCASMTDDVGWVATGRVENHSDKEQTFLISFYFLNGNKPVNYDQSRVVAPAGETVPWAAAQEFSVKDAKLTCEVIAVS